MIYQDLLDIKIAMLHSDDHGIIIAREDYDGTATRNIDVDSMFSLFPLRKIRRYYVLGQHLSTCFLQKELQLPQPAKPPAMMLPLSGRVLLAIFGRRWEE